MNHLYLSTGEDVPELQTGIEDNYPGSISPYAPQDGSFVILAQDAELNGALFLCIRFT